MSNVNGSFLDKNGLTYLWSKLKELIGAKASVDDIYGLGPNSVIGNTDNLNSYETPGIYRRNSASNSNLVNCPVTDAAFKLVVEYVNSDVRLRQSLYPLYDTATYYSRVKLSTGWKEWRVFRDTFGLYKLGWTIPANADLNSYTTPGVYNSLDGTSITNTLSNCPITGYGFRLEVISTISDSSYAKQILIPNDDTGSHYVRRKRSSDWSAWKVFHNSEDTAVDIYGRGTEIPYKKGTSGSYELVSLDDYKTPGRYWYGGANGGIIDGVPAAGFTYSKVTSSTKPSDWDTGYYIYYYENLGTASVPVYSRLQKSDTIPTYVADTYYTRNGMEVNFTYTKLTSSTKPSDWDSEYYIKYFENVGTASVPVYIRLQKTDTVPTYVANQYYSRSGIGGTLTVEYVQRTDRILQRFSPLNGPGDAAYFYQREYLSSSSVLQWTSWYRVDGTGAIGTPLSAGTDVTELMPGRYFKANNTGITGLPSGFAGAFMVEVTNTTVSYRTQIILYRIGLDDDGTIWKRLETSAGWGDWLVYRPMNRVISDIYSLSYATTLDATANANSLTTPGVYVLNSNSNDSITNFPLKNKAFKLVVEYVNETTRYRQTFYPLDSTCTYYVRMKTADGENGWGSWYQFSGTAVS